jgi:prepilin-type N-terminal cleavage/methylation domain-containing protein
MVSLKNKSKGFTIVELLIVIVVIGILATLVIVTFTGIQQKARDSKRKTDIAAVQAALESYYSSNNTYPTMADLNSDTWRTANMKGFDSKALQDPKSNSDTVAASFPTSGFSYVYVVTGGDASTLSSPTTCHDTDGATDPCTNFKISAKLESDSSTISKQSNN